MLTVWWARGQANSDKLRTHGTICGAGHICCGGRRHVRRVVGRSRGITYLARTLSGAWGRWHPSRTNNGSFVVGGLSNFQGGGY